MRITFLGTGTSHGIPVIGCGCAVCGSSNPKNRRNRIGVWLEDEDGTSAVIDVSSEFRVAALQNGLKRVDFALLTHTHSDHVSGLDDLRIFSQRSGKGIPIYGDARTLADVRSRFAYAFQPTKAYGGGVPQYELREVTETLQVGRMRITPLPVMHGPEPILGFRVNDFAFITDVTVIPDSTLDLLRGLDVLALDCLRREPHSTHLCLDQAVAYAKRIGAKRTYLIHLTHDLEHEETERELPPGIHVSYDGLKLESA
jgi:phosphoribosyl 1,2-cyclic phosphate phosphodiesterase